ncbi:hypothetical protein I6I97_12430 [Sphingobacterium multivorum]|uniref:hypothetical protein n=1 Tax=Sphingobacterium multivorum TaxID=28454 RepID=UPI001917CA38|nr:hypothetical protein [Sphingobacterium multivorum]QQT60074.1 hypothetical protein I6I97_12430 [Sphingobacterium multivorum]
MTPEQKKRMLQAAKDDPDLKAFPVKKKWVLFCLKLTKGIVSSACQNAGISRRAFYDWYGENRSGKPNPDFDPKFKEAADDIRLITHEWVESKLLENIDNNDEKAIEFYLSNNYREKYTSSNAKLDVTTKGQSLNKSFYDFLREVSVDEEEEPNE